MRTKDLLNRAEIISSEYDTPGSMFYYPYGWKIRNKIYHFALSESDNLGYKEIHLPNILNKSNVEKIHSFANVMNGYLHISDKKSLAASHEGVIYSFLSRYLRMKPYDLPIRWSNLDGVFRKPKNTSFPFSYGERASFLECYGFFETKEEATTEYNKAIKWNRKILNYFSLPYVEVVRLAKANKAVSIETTCIDTFLPSVNKTVITGMTYFHDTIFTKVFNVKFKEKLSGKNKLVHSVHFGLSDNLLFSILDTYKDERGLILPSNIAPYEIILIYDENFKNIEYLKFVENIKLSFSSISIEFLSINKSKYKQIINKKILQGYPILIILSKKEFEKKNCLVYYRHKRVSEVLPLSKFTINFIKKNLNEYNLFLDKMVNDIKNKMLWDCYSIDDVINALENNKIAKLYGGFEPYSIQKKLNYGEVLGIDIFSKNILYIARRI